MQNPLLPTPLVPHQGHNPRGEALAICSLLLVLGNTALAQAPASQPAATTADSDSQSAVKQTGPNTAASTTSLHHGPASDTAIHFDLRPHASSDGNQHLPEEILPRDTRHSDLASGDLARPKYLVEEIVIQGNGRTHESVIMERIMVRPGEILDEERVELSRLRLLSTGYFTGVSLSLRRGSQKGQVVLVVDIVERLPLPILEGIYLGFSETTPFFGGVSMVDPNFLGRGLELGGGFVLSPDQQSYRVRMSGSSLFGTPIGARMELFWLLGREPVPLGDDPRAGGKIGYDRRGGYAGLSLNAGTYQRFMVDYHGELIDADPSFDAKVRSHLAPQIQPGFSYLSALQLSYQRDSRDRFFVPTSGSNLFVGVKLSTILLLSEYEYSRYHLSYEQYIPTFRDHSFSLRLDFGVIQPGIARGNVSGAPFFEAYYIGDYAYYRANRNSLPRQLGLNVSAFSTYDDIIGSFTVSYAWPFYVGGNWFYRCYFYTALNISEGTTVRELLGEDPGDNPFPPETFDGTLKLATFDGGLKLDTVVGTFVFSGSYMFDLVF